MRCLGDGAEKRTETVSILYSGQEVKTCSLYGLILGECLQLLILLEWLYAFSFAFGLLIDTIVYILSIYYQFFANCLCYLCIDSSVIRMYLDLKFYYLF